MLQGERANAQNPKFLGKIYKVLSRKLLNEIELKITVIDCSRPDSDLEGCTQNILRLKIPKGQETFLYEHDNKHISVFSFITLQHSYLSTNTFHSTVDA